MRDISTDLLRRVAPPLPAGNLKTEIEAKLPYRPEQLFGAKATHPEYGDVLVGAAEVNSDGHVAVIFENPEYDCGFFAVLVPIDALTFEQQTAAPKVLWTVEELAKLPKGSIVEGALGVVAKKGHGCLWHLTDYFHPVTTEKLFSYRPLTVIRQGTGDA